MMQGMGSEWGNWRMEWVASTLHTTSEHGVSGITTADVKKNSFGRLQLKCDGTRLTHGRGSEGETDEWSM